MGLLSNKQKLNNPQRKPPPPPRPNVTRMDGGKPVWLQREDGSWIKAMKRASLFNRLVLGIAEEQVIFYPPKLVSHADLWREFMDEIKEKLTIKKGDQK